MIEENNLKSLITTHRESLEISHRLEIAKVKRERIQPFIRSPLIQAAQLIAQEEAQKSLAEGKKPLFINATQLCVHVFEQFIIRYHPDLVEQSIANYEKQ